MEFNNSIQTNYIDKESEDFKVLFKSEPILIGKLYWKVIVYKDLKFDVEQSIKLNSLYGTAIGNGCYSTYCFYKEGDGYRSHWSGMKNHPKYNFNDGTYAGLPKSLTKLYHQNEVEINNALSDKEVVVSTLF